MAHVCMLPRDKQYVASTQTSLFLIYLRLEQTQEAE